MGETVDPVVNALSRPFWAAAAGQRLVLPRCAGTGRFFWPPAPISPFGGGPVSWQEASPGGIILAAVTYRRAFQQAFAALLPYGIALVELDCGVRLQVHVRHPDAAGAPPAGSRVHIAFASLVDDGPPVPVLAETTPYPDAEINHA